MLLLGYTFYVAATAAVWQFAYHRVDTRLAGDGRKILSLPAGPHNGHWARNLVARADGRKLYVSIGSSSNVADRGMEAEAQRANILEFNPDGSGVRVYASGLRNPTGLAKIGRASCRERVCQYV